MSFRSSAWIPGSVLGRAARAGICGILLASPSLPIFTGRALAAAPVPAAAAAVAQSGPVKNVSFLGYRALVPASWPVVNLHAKPTSCVRFDLHAVYLGVPGPAERCPAHVVAAKTEALLVEPLAAGGATMGTADDMVAHQYLVADSAAGVEVIATYGNDQELIKTILGTGAAHSVTLERAQAGPAPPSTPLAPATQKTPPAPASPPTPWAPWAPPTPSTPLTPQTSGVPSTPLTPITPLTPVTPAPPPPLLPVDVTNGVGLGFDTCTTPDAATMQAWIAHSPYRAVGIYIGGSDRACAQPNLTAGWVSQQAAAGWRFIPLYVGPQAQWGQITAPIRQGVSAADDAALQARALGFGPGAPLYYDMEAYPRRQSRPALRFLSAWTRELHLDGYASGVYSSSESAVADLAYHYAAQPGYLWQRTVTMPDVIYDALWNGQADTSDGLIPPGDWADHQRIHQYSGGTLRTYGGHRLTIDRDYLDVMLGPAAPQQRDLRTRPRHRTPGAGQRVRSFAACIQMSTRTPHRRGVVPSHGGSRQDAAQRTDRNHTWVGSGARGTRPPRAESRLRKPAEGRRTA